MTKEEEKLKLIKDVFICFLIFAVLISSALYLLYVKNSRPEPKENIVINNDNTFLQLPFKINKFNISIIDLLDISNITPKYAQNSVVLQSDMEGKNNYILLRRSSGWSEYIWGIDATLLEGEELTLISNYSDENNYTSCIFSETYIRIDQIYKGEVKHLAVIKNDIGIKNTRSIFSMTSVSGSIKCHIGLKNVLGVISKDLLSGGVGISINKDTKLNIFSIEAYPVSDATSFLSKKYEKYVPIVKKNIEVATSTNIDKIIIPEIIPEIEQNIPVKNKILSLIVDGVKVIQTLNTIPSINIKVPIGTIATSSSGLSLGSKTTPSTLVYLDGAFSWDNYKVDVVLDWGPGSDFSLIARYDNPNDYVSCTYYDYGRIVSVNGYRDGEQVKRAQSPELPVRYYPVWLNNNFSMEVSDNMISCFIDGQLVVKSNIPRGLNEGSFGLKINDSGKAGAGAFIKNLTVSSVLEI